MELIDKDALLVEIDRQKIGYNVDGKHSVEYDVTRKIIDVINSLEVKEVDLEKEITNNDHKITIGTKIRSKANPDLILSIISNDCHEDEFECSNGSV